MHFEIIYNTGTSKFVKAKSKAKGEEIESALRKLRHLKKIRNFKIYEFETVELSDLVNDAA